MRGFYQRLGCQQKLSIHPCLKCPIFLQSIYLWIRQRNPDDYLLQSGIQTHTLVTWKDVLYGHSFNSLAQAIFIILRASQSLALRLLCTRVVLSIPQHFLLIVKTQLKQTVVFWRHRMWLNTLKIEILDE